MKNTVKSFLFASLFFLSIGAFAQGENKEAKFATSAQCEMCKDRIEKAMLKTKGILKAEVNESSKELTVAYDPKLIDEDKIKKAVSKVGYDAGDVKANPGAYKKLPKCCKKKS